MNLLGFMVFKLIFKETYYVDSFQIMYEIFKDENGKNIEMEISLQPKLSGKDNSLYYFNKKGSEGHYAKMEKVLKALMKTPINGARLSHHLV